MKILQDYLRANYRRCLHLWQRAAVNNSGNENKLNRHIKRWRSLWWDGLECVHAKSCLWRHIARGITQRTLQGWHYWAICNIVIHWLRQAAASWSCNNLSLSENFPFLLLLLLSPCAHNHLLINTNNARREPWVSSELKPRICPKCRRSLTQNGNRSARIAFWNATAAAASSLSKRSSSSTWRMEFPTNRWTFLLSFCAGKIYQTQTEKKTICDHGGGDDDWKPQRFAVFTINFNRYCNPIWTGPNHCTLDGFSLFEFY